MLNISSFFQIPTNVPTFHSVKATIAPYVSEALKAGQAFFENPRPLLGRVNWKIALPVALLITAAAACIFLYSRKPKTSEPGKVDLKRDDTLRPKKEKKEEMYSSAGRIEEVKKKITDLIQEKLNDILDSAENEDDKATNLCALHNKLSSLVSKN